MAERVVILGGGESGTGAALLAKAKGYDVFVSDQGTLKDKYRDEIINAGIAFEEGKHTAEQILNANIIIKSPGIPEKAEMVKKAKAAGIKIIDELEFAYQYVTGKIIAITGTNGKTTTTLLTYHLLKSAGYNVALAGNVGLSLARQVINAAHDWYVIEISSYQLDGTVKFKPVVGVLLNITPDHLDRYDYKMENYIESKFRIAMNMDKDGLFVYYKDDEVLKHEMTRRIVIPQKTGVSITGDVMDFPGFSIIQSETTLKGPHNIINTMSAVSAALFAGVSEKDIRAALKTFKNAPHRLESVATINGVEFVNDSKATNVDSVIYGLGSYTRPKSLVWIAGGIDKGNDYNLIKEQVDKKVKALICLGKDNAKLKDFFSPILNNIQETQSVKDLVRMALKSASQGDVVLLSPACASFDLFKNYEDRGDQFRAAVLELKKEVGQ
ncbi:MAG TPA: UDP-N-acetylmuramoyl-L-alanine--D-glutamate ligase [Cyclobacteriaceae bacterium]|nr:UDP-N-acetylmuramoyl-L-alanine--D-glutamate ligase [Cyclobacteriaceae bacterium]